MPVTLGVEAALLAGVPLLLAQPEAEEPEEAAEAVDSVRASEGAPCTGGGENGFASAEGWA